MRHLTVLGAFLILAVPIGAAAQSRPGTFSLTGYSDTFDGGSVLTAKKNKPVAEITVSLTDAVQLDGDIPADAAKATGADSRAPLVSGKMLLSNGKGNAYCGEAKFVLDRVAPCLVDHDNDGRFDEIFRAMDPAAGYPNGLVMYKGLPMGAIRVPNAFLPLPVPVPYHHIDSSVIPRTHGKIWWSSTYKVGQPGPVRIYFGYEATRALLDPMKAYAAQVTFDGAPVDVELNGITLTVEGLGSNGELKYRLRGKLNTTPIAFSVAPGVFHWTIYY